MNEKVKKIRKEGLQALDKRGAIKWGLSTSLKYEATIEYICELLSCIKELEEGFEMMKFGWNEEVIKLVKAEARIKELERVEEFATKNIFFLQERLDEARARIKELEEGFNDQVEMRNKLTLIKFELEAKVKELGEGIERYLNDPEFDTDILTKLIEKENKDG